MKILVVVDEQVDFTSGVLGNEECLASVDKVCDLINSGNYDLIIATKDTHEKNYLDTQEGKNLPVVHCVKGTEGHELHPNVKSALKGKNFVEIEKETFGSVDLGRMIKDIYLDVHKVEIDFCGVCTGICVINNVSIVKAFAPEVVVNVVADACACITPESHKIALDAMKTYQVNII